MITILSVSEFISQVNGIIAGEFIVEGEVSSLRLYNDRSYTFFDVKDETSTLNCIIWKSQITVPFEDGMKVRVTGYPEIYGKTGKFTFKVQRVEPVGDGSLKKAYLLLKQKLESEGLFASLRKRPLPHLPVKIGVIASRESDAFGDFKRILNNRWAGCEVNLYHTAVQGETAVGGIVEAFNFFNAHVDDYEVLVLIRGGGSLEDLAAFNSEEVVRAVYGSKIPVICGVGHERDESLADFAADKRASTPSNAAEIVVPDKHEFVTQLEFTADSIAGSLQQVLSRIRRQVEQGFYNVVSRFEAPLNASRLLLDKFNGFLFYLETAVARQGDFVAGAERLFNNVNPRRVLRRGYSITRNSQGQILRSSTQVDAGDKIVVELSEGKIESEVLGDKKGIQQAKLL